MASVVVCCRAPPYPPNAGDKVVTYGFLRCFAERGHDLHLVTYAEGEGDAEALEALADRVPLTATTVDPPARRLPMRARRVGRLATGRSHVMEMFRSDRYADAVAAAVRERAPGVVLAEHPYVAQHCRDDAAAAALDEAGARLVTNAHVVEYAAHRRRREYADDLATRLALRLEVPRLRERERAVYEASDRALVLGEGDREELADLATPVAHQRVALDPADYDPAPVGDGDPTVAFFGSYDWFPNRDGVRVFCDRAFPAVRERVPDARLLVAGRNATDEVRALGDRPGVEVLGEVDDLAGLVRGASAVVAPLRVGGGVRIKILESMAWGTPVVATPAAVEGVEATPGEDLLVDDDWDAFAAAVADLLADADRRRNVGERARTTVEETYATDVVGEQLVDNLGL